MRVAKRFTAVMCALFGGTYREQLAFERFGLSLLDTWIHVKLPWLPCKQNRDRVVCKIKDVPKRSFGKGTESDFSRVKRGSQ